MSVVWTKWVIILIELVSFGGVLKNILLIFLPLALRDNLYLDSRGIGSSYAFGHCLYV